MMSTSTYEVAQPCQNETPRFAVVRALAVQARRNRSGVSPAEEWANSITHALGLLLSVAGAAALVWRTAISGEFWQMTGCLVFGVTLVAVYAASTLSHYTTQPRWRFFFRTLDQAVIYLLIVGTYTPFGLIYLREGWWLAFLVLMWSGAILGFVSKMFFAHRVESVAVWSYIALGWLLGIAAIPLLTVIGLGAVACLFAGGVAYTAGTFFLVHDRKVRHFHAIWHLMVICGSACHFAAICLCVAM